MPPPTLKTFLAGMIFGLALTASAVYPPGVIIGQMQLQDWHMLKVFLTASGCSALILPLFSALDIARTSPRLPATIKTLPPYSANALGGLLLGFGLALTGACPGTVLAQIATGVPSGIFVLIGGVVGGTLWSGFGRNLREAQPKSPDPSSVNVFSLSSTNSNLTPPVPSQDVIYAKLNLSMPQAVFAYEILCVACMVLATALGSRKEAMPIHPVIGGILIGIAQAGSLLLTGCSLGVSNSYEEAGLWIRYIWGALSCRHSPSFAKPSTRSISFALGILAGSLVFSCMAPSRLVLHAGKGVELEVERLAAFLGGALMTFGARMAGGCTSGHGISGLATMGVASFVSVGAMFAGGIGLAWMIG